MNVVHGLQSHGLQSHGLKSVAEGRRRRTSLRDGPLHGFLISLSRRDIQPKAPQPRILIRGSAIRGSIVCCFFALLFLALLPPSAHAAPHYTTAAAARAAGERLERAGQYEAASDAYEQEAAIRRRTGDPQGAEVEQRRAERLRTDVALAVTAPLPTSGPRLAKGEPVAGCYLGALDDYAGGLRADEFAERVGRPLALCFDYSPYGAPFPLEWARRQARAGRMVQIAWEPHDIHAVRDDAYLNEWAEDAARCGTTVFLRFGGEMNGNWTPWGRDPKAYRQAFRLVHEVINRHADNVALVWAPGAIPTYNLDSYWPGDDVVDWVGISLYLVRFYDDDPKRPASGDGPASFIDPFYRKFAARHPLCLVECGVSRQARVEGRPNDAFAAARIFDLLDALKIRYPRLKMFCWFTRNNLQTARAGRRLNDYSLPGGSGALKAFQSAIADPYFLSAPDAEPPYRYLRLNGHLPAGYVGGLSAAISTYTLTPTLEASRNGVTRRAGHPFSVFVPPGHGPLTVTVRDERGRAAKTLVLKQP